MATLSMAHFRILRTRLLPSHHRLQTTLTFQGTGSCPRRTRPSPTFHVAGTYRRPLSTASKTALNQESTNTTQAISAAKEESTASSSSTSTTFVPYMPTHTARVLRPKKEGGKVETPKLSKYRVDKNTSKPIKRGKITKKMRRKAAMAEAETNEAAVQADGTTTTETFDPNPVLAQADEAVKATKAATTTKTEQATRMRETAVSTTTSAIPTSKISREAATVAASTSTDVILGVASAATSRLPRIKPVRSSSVSNAVPSIQASSPSFTLPAAREPSPSLLKAAETTTIESVRFIDGTRQVLASSSYSSPSFSSSAHDPPFSSSTTVQRRPSQAPTRIDRHTYRTILDWSVHATVQPDDFNFSLPAVLRSRPLMRLASTPMASGSSATGSSYSSAISTSETTFSSATIPPSLSAGYSSNSRKEGSTDRNDRACRSEMDTISGAGGAITTASATEAPVNKWRSSPRKIGFESLDEALTSIKNSPKPRRRESFADDRGESRSRTWLDRAASSIVSSAVPSDDTFGREKPSRVLSPRTTQDWSRRSDEGLRWQDRRQDAFTGHSSKPLGRRSRDRDGDDDNHGGVMKAIVIKEDLEVRKAKEQQREFLYSPRVVLPALRTKMRSLFTLYYCRDASPPLAMSSSDEDALSFNHSPQVLLTDCLRAAQDAGVNVIKTNQRRLEELAGSEAHQGVVLEASFRPSRLASALGPVSANNEYQLEFKDGNGPLSYKSLPAGPIDTATTAGSTSASLTTTAAAESPLPSSASSFPPVWLVMEQVWNPSTMGDILRSAWYLGVDGVLYKRSFCAHPTVEVSVASAGALEQRPLYSIQSLVKFIMNSQENGWNVVGAHQTYGSKRCRPLYTLPTEGVDRPTIFVVGNNGLEVSKQIAKKCDSWIQIPQLSKFDTEMKGMGGPVVTGTILARLMAGRMKWREQNPRPIDSKLLGQDEQSQDRGLREAENGAETPKVEVKRGPGRPRKIVDAPAPSKQPAKKPSSRLSW